jgi:hypothetical protein
MNTYKVVITETLQMTVEVDAPSCREAERIVTRNWENSDYILDADHFIGVKFSAPKQERNCER